MFFKKKEEPVFPSKSTEVVDKKKIKFEKKRIKTKAKLDKKKLAKFKHSWLSLMANLGLDNQMFETFTFTEMSVTEFGYQGKLVAPDALYFAMLDEASKKQAIQDKFGCNFIATKLTPRSKELDVKLVLDNLSTKEFIANPNLKPYELNMLSGLDYEPIIGSMLKYPHLLVQGVTSSGKTQFLHSLMLNIMECATPEECEFYIIQADKFDQIIFQDCPHTKAYAEELEDIATLVAYLDEEISRDFEVVRPYAKNIQAFNGEDYNKLIREKKIKGKQLPVKYIIIDEFMSLSPNNESNPKLKVLKDFISEKLRHIYQVARCVHCYVIAATQRATIDNMPSFMKSQSNLKVSFAVTNQASAQVAETPDAMFLDMREFIVKETGGKTRYGKTSDLSLDTIRELVFKHRIKNRKEFDFKKHRHLISFLLEEKDKKQTKKKSIPTAHEIRRQEKEENVQSSKEQPKANKKDIINSNQAKPAQTFDNLNKPKTKSPYYIPNYVPIEQQPNVTVIDTTKNNPMAHKNQDKVKKNKGVKADE